MMSSIPTWNELASTTRSDLAGAGCGRKWFEGVRPEHRLGIVNAYTKLKNLGLWGHVTSVVLPHPGIGDEPGSGPGDIGKFEFETKNASRLRDELTRRSDFTDPENVSTGWSSREDVDDCPLHFKHFGTDPKLIHVHIDQAGLSWKPQSWFKHLFYDYVGDGWQDVGEVSRMLRVQGHDWTRPVSSGSTSSSMGLPRRGFGGRLVQSVGQPAALRRLLLSNPTSAPTPRFRYQATPILGGPRPGRSTDPTGIPRVRITATPRAEQIGLRWLRPQRPRDPRPGYAGVSTTPRYEFRTRELPGQVRFGRGGRMEFPGVQITAVPRTHKVDSRGHPPELPSSRFDWTVRELPGRVRRGRGDRMEFPGMEITATPRPNLLRELGDRLVQTPTPPQYDFTVRQEPGPLHTLPGGGMEFPPMHVIATPTQPDHSPSLLRNLGRGLGPGR